MENCAIEDRVVRYWTIRSHDFGAVRKNELGSIMGRRWQEELEARLPERSPLNILDVGTGTGFFAILMAKLGHKVTGIDLTPAMLEEAAAMAAGLGLDIAFRHMDAQELDFPDGTFDVVLSRNLTWTLPQPEKAYAEWHRVLKPGGLLLNFDADYAANVRSESTQNCSVAPLRPCGHDGSAGGGKQRHHPGAGRGAEAACLGRNRAEKGRVFPLPDGFDGRPAGAGGG